MAFLSFADVQSLTEEAIRTRTAERIIKEASQTTAGKHVFLSHQKRDKPLLPGIIRFFEKHKASVYIAEEDEWLPDKPSPATAQILKGHIGDCPRFVALITENTSDSRWIPWELGLADGMKGVAPVATLPLSRTAAEEAWATQEYFGLYPRIYREEGGQEWRVFDPRDQKCWPLEYWLHKAVN